MKLWHYIAVLASNSIVSAQRTIQIDVKADWPSFAGQHVAEVSEFVAGFSSSSFWSFVDRTCQFLVSRDGDMSASEALQREAQRLALLDIPKTVRYLMETAVGLGT